MPAHIPPWVPVLFLVLVFLGYRQARPRTVRPGAAIVIAAAMFGLSLYGVIGAFGRAPLALAFWAAGYAIAAAPAARFFAPQGLVRAQGAVRVPGSWLPLVLLVALFILKFVLGFLAGTGSPLLHHALFGAAMGGLLGLLSGAFGARALAVHRCARGERAANRLPAKTLTVGTVLKEGR